MKPITGHPGRSSLSPALVADMEKKGIDIDRSLAVLDLINGDHGDDSASQPSFRIPQVDGRRVVDARGLGGFSVDRDAALARLSELGMRAPPDLERRGTDLVFTRSELVALGEELLGQAAWGVLNGGSATSYADRKKNQALGPHVYAAIQPGFELLAPLCEGAPKGLTPAYINPDGTPGESFLVLKMRAALRLAERAAGRLGGHCRRPILPFFQMTSDATDSALRIAYAEWDRHPCLPPVNTDALADPRHGLSAVQPLMSAYTHSADGLPRRVFDRAWGKEHSALALPGGHGQSFWVLAGVYRSLLDQGYRYAWIGNVDNSGYGPDPLALAVFALSGSEAAYELAYRTPVDIKGGILVEDEQGKLTIAELGQAMSLDRALEHERNGARILFNCATGLFDLAALVPRLDEIADALPLRVSEQDKDSGRYSQAEQNTWESMALFDSPLCLAVDKAERFMPAKLLAETILASGIVPGSAVPPDVAATARGLSEGMAHFLAGPCGLELKGGRWQPPA